MRKRLLRQSPKFVGAENSAKNSGPKIEKFNKLFKWQVERLLCWCFFSCLHCVPNRRHLRFRLLCLQALSLGWTDYLLAFIQTLLVSFSLRQSVLLWYFLKNTRGRDGGKQLIHSDFPAFSLSSGSQVYLSEKVYGNLVTQLKL